MSSSINRSMRASSSLSIAALRAAISSSAAMTNAANKYAVSRSVSKQYLAAALYSSPYTSMSSNNRFHSRSFATSRDPTALLDAAGLGDIKRMEDLLSKGYSANDCDYDKRRPLHIAAAEGRIDAINFLLANGADVNAEDRYGFTPLDDALTARIDEAIALLRSKNGTLGKARMQEVGPIVCQAASEGNVGHLQRLHDCGVDMNRSDYDGRSPLHLASSEGHSTTVEWLLSHGANVNAVDRFGNTPLGDAMRSRAKSRKQVTDILVRNGAVLESAQWEIKNDPSLQQSISRSLQFLINRLPKAEFVESWIPNDDESEFTVFEGSSYVSKESQSKLSSFLSIHGETSISNSQSHALGKAWQNKTASIQADLTEKDVPGRFNEAKTVGLRAGLVIPLIHQDKPFALLRFYLTEIPKMSTKELEEFQCFTSGIVTAGVFKRNKLPAFNEIHDFPKNQMAEVYQKIVAEEVFNANLIYHELDWFYHLGLHKYYFERFSPRVIADHVHAFVAAKKLAAATGKPEEILLNIESKAVDGSPSFLFMCPYEHNHLVEVEKRIQMAIQKVPSSRAYTLEFFKTERPIIPAGTKQMALYVLETSEWANPKKLGSSDGAVQEVASISFLRTKTPQIRERYQQVMTQALSKIAPLAEVYPTYRDGTIPIMFAFLQSAGTTTSYMLQLTELLKQNGMIANRKFIETFANGIIVFSLYITPCPPFKIDQLLKQFSMLHLVPESPLTSKFLNGEYTAEEYTYLSASSRFVYYFLSRRTEEFDVLSKSLKNDPLNLSRLRLLQTRLKREAVSQDRIANCVMSHPAVVTELFKDFHRCATQKNPKIGEPWPINNDLLSKIKNEATTVMDQQILNAMLTFNQHLLKTNFYTKSKSALSFRMCPDFLKESDWPTVPYGLFFLMGSDFQGFHVRFADIARGGIRVIRSTDRQAYSHNLETLFAENYGLAYTQNKKNKDIPEFGSKGTILLNLGNRNAFLAFQKYVSGLVDLLIGKEEIVDNYGKTELLFLGPDEGTADFMEWAARYASKRGYPYWRSFTTGKPPSLGGIPHDKFGMTTRGVHRYVLNALAKFNLPEEKVTKFQTGGPDGDLGSNEILLSKDITKAIVDGSGVLYDPNGINREELVRLATKRFMIKEFDVAQLSPQGFRVLVNDTNVRLPDGTLVESGLAFRNEFHLNPLAAADLFVPCGGRPESVNLSNVNRLFDDKGKPRFKIVIEGANLFFSQDSRMVMENAGVVQYKDASSNKGGVTSSSLEVLASLALSAEEFDAHMAVKDEKNPPAFYMEYVQEIQHRIENDADLEFECIWREHERTHTHRYLLTDQVSDKINELNEFIQKSPLWQNNALRYKVLEEAIPKSLIKLIGLENVLSRVPENYIRAIFGAYLASRYVYKQGIEANEFAFFEFMQKYLVGTTNNNNNNTAEVKEAKVEAVNGATVTPTPVASHGKRIKQNK